MAIVVWVLSTAVLYFVCVAASNAIEALVHSYGARLLVMLLVGTAIGAFASAIGYGFLLLSVLLLLRLWRVRGKLAAMSGNASAATKYALPTAALILSAMCASYILSIEACAPGSKACKRVFFERVYTPPNLVGTQ